MVASGALYVWQGFGGAMQTAIVWVRMGFVLDVTLPCKTLLQLRKQHLPSTDRGRDAWPSSTVLLAKQVMKSRHACTDAVNAKARLYIVMFLAWFTAA